PAKVRVLLGALLGWSFAPGAPPAVPLPLPGVGDVAALLFLLNLGSPVVPSALTEDQRSLQQIVASDALRLFQLWTENQYISPTPFGPPMWLRQIPGGRAGLGGLAAVNAVPPGGAAAILGAGAGGALRVGLYPAGAALARPAPVGYSS